jgi:RecA-family ATPase
VTEHKNPDFYENLAEEFIDAEDAAPAPNGGAKEPIELLPIDPTTLADIPVPERQWLVPDWIPMARATGLYGAGGEGKTLLAQMLATACAIGALWLGLPVRQCRSLLLFCEDDQEEMWRRQEDINRHYGCTFADLGAMRWLPRLGRDNTLMAFEAGRARLAPLFYELLHVAAEHGAQLIVADTLADVFSGSENDRGHARAFAQTALGGLARQTGGAVLALAHPSLSGTTSGSGSSGSTGWVGTFRAHLYLSSPKPEDGELSNLDARILTRGKANFARRGETIDVHWKDGVFIATRAPTGIIASIERKTSEHVFRDLLGKVTAEGQHVSHNPRAGNYAPRIFALRPDRERFTKVDFERAMASLLATGTIKITTYKDSYRRDIECLCVST